jgi:long-chain acyl-CoA synthetase
MYLTQGLHRALQQHPTRLATIQGESRRDYAGLAARVRRWAGMLAGLGLGRGDRLALLAPNTALQAEAWLGAWWAGAVVVPLNTRWSLPELAFALRDADTPLLVADAGFAAQIPALRAAAPGLRHVVLDGPGAEGAQALEPLLAAAAQPEDVREGGDSLAAIFYTGGTTGTPKGVMLSHGNLWSAYMARMAQTPMPPGAVMLHTAPIFHIAGFSRLVSQLLFGATGVFLPAFDIAALMAVVEREQVTDVTLIPTMMEMILAHPDFAPARLRSLARVGYGASVVPEALLERLIAQLPWIGFTQAYGMTESCAVLTANPPEHHRPGHPLLRSAGRAGFAVEARVVDAEGREVPRGTVGEVEARGPNIMRGYWNRPTETDAAFRRGWYRTGDGGYMDEEGYLFIVDRLKDMIITGGENVYSAEVENALCAHPAVAQAAVIGIPHPQWGEAVHAVVVPQPGAEPDEALLRAHCRALIAGFKVPKSIEFRNALPLSRVGKVLKTELRAPFWAGRDRSVG